MSEHTITIKRNITDEQVSDVMSSALTGMTYWADEAYVVGEYEGYTSDALANGRYIKIHDSEEEQYHNLTLKKLLKGFELTPWFNFEDYDMYDAEMVVQRALFGKVIYG